MKVNNQYPKVPVRDKPISTEKDKGIEGKGDHKNASLAIGSNKASQSEFTISRIKKSIESAPDVNAEKVKALKEKIQKGEYQIDTGKLAKNMIKKSVIEDF